MAIISNRLSDNTISETYQCILQTDILSGNNTSFIMDGEGNYSTIRISPLSLNKFSINNLNYLTSYNNNFNIKPLAVLNNNLTCLPYCNFENNQIIINGISLPTLSSSNNDEQIILFNNDGGATLISGYNLLSSSYNLSATSINPNAVLFYIYAKGDVNVAPQYGGFPISEDNSYGYNSTTVTINLSGTTSIPVSNIFQTGTNGEYIILSYNYISN